MRDLRSILDIVEIEITRCSTQYYVKDKQTYQPIIIKFDVLDHTENMENMENMENDQQNGSRLSVLISDSERVRPFLDSRYGGSIKIEINGERLEVSAIDSYYMKFLMFHVMCEGMFGQNIPSTIEESGKYLGTALYALGSDVSGILDVLFDRRARNQLKNLQCKCTVYPEDTEKPVRGVFVKTEHDDLRIHTDTYDYHPIVLDNLEVSGRTGEYRNYRTARIDIEEPIGMFLITCMAITNLRSRCLDANLKVRIHELTDYARIIVDDPKRFDEVQNLDSFYYEVRSLLDLLKD